MRFTNILIIALFISSCETIVTDSLVINDSEPLLVVEGGIERFENNLNALQTIKLTTTNNFLSDEPNPIVENAIVSISDGSGRYTLDYVGGGYYNTEEIEPQIGSLYTLEILWEEKSYTAADVLNAVPDIDSLYAEFEEESIFTDEGYFLKLNSSDPAGISNFYHYRVYRNNEFITVPDPGNSRTLILSDEFFDGQFREGIEPNEEVVFELGDLASVDQMGISEAYFEFLFQVYEQTGSQGGGFAGNPPPASIRGNIISNSESNSRALGFFYATDVERKSIVVQE